MGILGESGCGKTTVARCVVGLQRPDSGVDLARRRRCRRRRSRSERRAVQLIFQDPFSSLNPRMTIGAMLKQLLEFHDWPTATAADRSRELLALVGLPADALTRHPAAFSGGQRQRIAIARAWRSSRASSSPTNRSPLSTSRSRRRSSTLRRPARSSRHQPRHDPHNLAAVRHVCDRVAVMYLGQLVEVGVTAEVFADPHIPTRARC